MTDCKTCGDTECGAPKIEGSENSKEAQEQQALNARMCKIKHKIIVMSGKGGVGKSTVAVNLASALAEGGSKVGLMDVDIHGPSVPGLLGLTGMAPKVENNTIVPIGFGSGLHVISIGFMLQNQDDAIIWRGPMKISVIKQFLKDVQWGELDYLIVDSPPGTGDEPLSVCQMIPNIDGAVIVTTPQKIAISDVRKSVTFCNKLSLPVLGVIENMSGIICPDCGKDIKLFKSGGAEEMAGQMEIPFLGRLPMEPAIMEASDEGIPFILNNTDSPAKDEFRKIITSLKEKI